MSKFLDPLNTTEISDSIWEIADHPFRYQSDVADRLITVPVGFFTDFASVPRFLPVVYACLGDLAHQPAVVHDWLYYAAITTREVADQVMLEAMDIWGMSVWKRYPIYWGVRAGGWAAWNKHRKDGDPQNGKFKTSPDIKSEGVQ